MKHDICILPRMLVPDWVGNVVIRHDIITQNSEAYYLYTFCIFFSVNFSAVSSGLQTFGKEFITSPQRNYFGS